MKGFESLHRRRGSYAYHCLGIGGILRLLIAYLYVPCPAAPKYCTMPLEEDYVSFSWIYKTFDNRTTFALSIWDKSEVLWTMGLTNFVPTFQNTLLFFLKNNVKIIQPITAFWLMGYFVLTFKKKSIIKKLRKNS
jgi:hypothetical protein